MTSHLGDTGSTPGSDHVTLMDKVALVRGLLRVFRLYP